MDESIAECSDVDELRIERPAANHVRWPTTWDSPISQKSSIYLQLAGVLKSDPFDEKV